MDIRKSFKELTKPKKKEIQVGSLPIINLLPEDIVSERATKKAKSKSIKIIVSSVIVLLVAAAVPFGITLERQFKLSSLETEAQNIKTSQAQYQEIIDAQDTLKNIESAEKSVSKKEVNWSEFSGKIESALPENSSLKSFSYDSKKSNGGYVITTSISVPSLSSLESFKKNLENIDGYKSADFSGISGGGGSDGNYSLTATLTFDNKIAWNRYGN
jgi:hypothetical protein